MKPCKTCEEYTCSANGSDYVSMKCGSEEGFIRVASDCFSLPNVEELCHELLAEAKKTADTINKLREENAKLKAAFDEACAANDDLFQKLTAMKAVRMPEEEP